MPPLPSSSSSPPPRTPPATPPSSQISVLLFVPWWVDCSISLVRPTPSRVYCISSAVPLFRFAVRGRTASFSAFWSERWIVTRPRSRRAPRAMFRSSHTHSKTRGRSRRASTRTEGRDARRGVSLDVRGPREPGGSSVVAPVPHGTAARANIHRTRPSPYKGNHRQRPRSIHSDRGRQLPHTVRGDGGRSRRDQRGTVGRECVHCCNLWPLMICTADQLQ